ncbi:MAG: hypothetical protein QGG88_04920, partial [Gammaproteobacteria bacterium]|nr:hypothetical protein [Gammaproteobacteria bacterium]
QPSGCFLASERRRLWRRQAIAKRLIGSPVVEELRGFFYGTKVLTWGVKGLPKAASEHVIVGRDA